MKVIKPRLVIPEISLTSGAIEALKYLALLFMTLDHVNKVIFNHDVPWLSIVGRLAFPMFGFVLAYNLARAELQVSAYIKIIKKMALAGVIATPFYMPLFNTTDHVMLNIMFSLMLVVSIMFLLEKGLFWHQMLALLIFVVGGAFVDYLWFGLLYCLVAWSYCRHPSAVGLLALVIALATLFYVNDNHWALAALLVLLMFMRVDIKLPRLKWFFYVYYPAHISILWGIKTFWI
ncbi:MAG: TraX family protein [Methylotenera sp.]|nr:TraX family protein [Methylotenera sp.]